MAKQHIRAETRDGCGVLEWTGEDRSRLKVDFSFAGTHNGIRVSIIDPSRNDRREYMHQFTPREVEQIRETPSAVGRLMILHRVCNDLLSGRTDEP